MCKLFLPAVIFHLWMREMLGRHPKKAKVPQTLLRCIGNDDRDRISSWGQVENSQSKWMICVARNVSAKILKSAHPRRAHSSCLFLFFVYLVLIFFNVFFLFVPCYVEWVV